MNLLDYLTTSGFGCIFYHSFMPILTLNFFVKQKKKSLLSLRCLQLIRNDFLMYKSLEHI
jgi:hypothetical protein